MSASVLIGHIANFGYREIMHMDIDTFIHVHEECIELHNSLNRSEDE